VGRAGGVDRPRGPGQPLGEAAERYGSSESVQELRPVAGRRGVEEWRALPGFQQRVERIRALLDGFEPHTLEPVVEVGHSDTAGSGDEL
jgi:hypothetical protein